MLKLEGRVMTTGLSFPEGPVAMDDGSVIVVEITAMSATMAASSGAPTTVSRDRSARRPITTAAVSSG